MFKAVERSVKWYGEECLRLRKEVFTAIEKNTLYCQAMGINV